MLVLQIINAVVIYSWLFGVLYLLYRHAIGGGAHVRRLQNMLNENAKKSAEAAMVAAEAAQESAHAAANLADLLRKRDA
jgi:hypothetical protein